MTKDIKVAFLQKNCFAKEFPNMSGTIQEHIIYEIDFTVSQSEIEQATTQANAM